MTAIVYPSFWRGKRVLITGHTGLPGSWTALRLHRMGAEISGFALPPADQPGLYALARIGDLVKGVAGDLRDAEAVRRAVVASKPQIVLHMAGLRRAETARRAPLEAFAVNATGTAHVLGALREAHWLEAALIVTTGPFYGEGAPGRAFLEADPPGADDPLQASLSAADLFTTAMARTFFTPARVAIGRARLGSLIDGGEFAEGRLVADICRAAAAGKPVLLRQPHALRTWRHVLDGVGFCLAYAQALAQGRNPPAALNLGAASDDMVSVAEFTLALQKALGARPDWRPADGHSPHASRAPALDGARARAALGFRDRLVGHAAVKAIADWRLALARGEDMRAFSLRSIADHERP